MPSVGVAPSTVLSLTFPSDDELIGATSTATEEGVSPRLLGSFTVIPAKPSILNEERTPPIRPV